MNDWDLWLMNRDGSGEFKLIDNTYRDTGTCFNPAGTKIVFGRITSTMPVQADVYIINSDGSGKQRITYNNFADFDPSFSPKSPSFIKNENGQRKDYILFNNYPNPFNSSTEIYYSVNKHSFVRISVYDISGKEIAGLVNSVQTQGIYSIIFNADGLSSGVYFYKLTAGDFRETKKMVLMK